MALHTIQEGALVKVAPYKGSSGGVGVVKKKRQRLRTPEEFSAVFAAIHATGQAGGAPPSPPRFQFDIKYTGVETRLTQDVSPSRVVPYSFATTARKRPGQTTATRPSIISPSHQPIVAVATAQPVVTSQKTTTGCTTWLIEESKKKGSKYQGGNKAMAYLWTKRADKGWLQRLEARVSGRILAPRKPTDEEKNLALKLYVALLSDVGSTRLVAAAWGVGRQTIYNWKAKADESPTMVVARKKRSDTGKTLFNSDSQRAASYTEANVRPQHLFAVTARAKEGETITHAQAIEEYAALPTVFKAETIAIAIDFKERSPFLEAELKRVLAQTNGSISWANLERALNDGLGDAKMVSASTIRRFITATPGFQYKTTRILPFLSIGSKEKRYTWGLEF
jgi:hypothetical protein